MIINIEKQKDIPSVVV